MGMLDRDRITTTYAGEALSLAAAGATLDVLWEEPVQAHLDSLGRRLMDGFNAAARSFELPARAVGVPVAPQFRFSDDPDREAAAFRVFERALLERGIFPSRPFFMMYAHQTGDVEETIEAVQFALERVAESRCLEVAG
jgi:glutamate-1-semialdehyde 2,1-aminomutase